MKNATCSGAVSCDIKSPWKIPPLGEGCAKSWHGFSGNEFWPTGGCIKLYFCFMLAKLFKAFVGDKSANDIKEVQPVVDRVKEIEPSLAGLSADELDGMACCETKIFYGLWPSNVW